MDKAGRNKKKRIEYLVSLTSVFLILVLLVAGCAGSPVTGSTQPASTQTPGLTASQTPVSSQAPQKPGILSRKTYTLSSAAMELTLKSGDRINGYPVWRDLERGDIVQFTSPDSNRYSMISRIVGLPGETIQVQQGRVLINGTPLNEPYIAEPPSYSQNSTAIPANSYYTFGDNRNHSYGSQNFGHVPLTNIHYIIDR